MPNFVRINFQKKTTKEAYSRAEELFGDFDLSCLDKMVRISDLLFSPDGQFLFFSTARVNVEANRRDKAFFLMDIRKQQQPFEFKQRGVHSLKFSPCGKNFFFNSYVY